MKTLANYLVAIFMLMYWIFRIVVTYMYDTGKAFVTQPLNEPTEIVLLFVTLLCIILFVKRIKFGGVLYITTYYAYFGVDLFKHVKVMFDTYTFDINSINGVIWSAVAVILATVVMIDLLYDNVRTPDQKNTDWYYNNKDYDRKYDPRADRNHYKYQ